MIRYYSPDLTFPFPFYRYISNNSTRTQKDDDSVSFTVALKSVVYAGSAATGRYFVDAMPIKSMASKPLYIILPCGIFYLTHA